MTLKSRTKASIAGIVGILLGGLVIRYALNTAYVDTAIVGGLCLASACGFYEGARKAEEDIEGTNGQV